MPEGIGAHRSRRRIAGDAARSGASTERTIPDGRDGIGRVHWQGIAGYQKNQARRLKNNIGPGDAECPDADRKETKTVRRTRKPRARPPWSGAADPPPGPLADFPHGLAPGGHGHRGYRPAGPACRKENIMPIRYLAIVAALALSQAPPAAGADGRPGYSYVEARVDLSTTGNDTRGARSDAEGRLVGIAASWEVHESWYVKAGYSLEGKTFTNAVAGTMLSLRTKQMEITAGAGRSWALGRDTDLYAEGFVLHTRVEHDIPDVRVAERGPLTVGKRDRRTRGHRSRGGRRPAAPARRGHRGRGADRGPGCRRTDRDPACPHRTPENHGQFLHRPVRCFRHVDEPAHRQYREDRSGPALRILSRPMARRPAVEVNGCTAGPRRSGRGSSGSREDGSLRTLTDRTAAPAPIRHVHASFVRVCYSASRSIRGDRGP